MTTSNPGRGLVRRLGLAAAAIFVLAASPQQRAEALSLASPGTAPAAKIATDGAMIQVRGGHGGGGHGGGFHGGGFHGGGFHGGGFHGGGFRAGPVFHGGGYGGYRAFHYGGYRHAYFRPHFFHRHHFRRFYGVGYYPYYYDYPHRYCRVIWTYYGPRRICHRPWYRYHYWHHHRHHHWHHYRYW